MQSIDLGIMFVVSIALCALSDFDLVRRLAPPHPITEAQRLNDLGAH
jgi:hypothetical protein